MDKSFEYTNIKDIGDLSYHLGVPLKRLQEILHKLNGDGCYQRFTVPKKNGEQRIISAPEGDIKYIQRRLANLLMKRLENTKTLTDSTTMHGFLPKRSIITNANQHKRKRYVYNIDLDSFFDSITFNRVRGYFRANRYFKLPGVAEEIAKIVCYKGKLPQGAPTSPIISNLIGQILDSRIRKLCKKYNLKYTRYVDDLTFSTNDKYFNEKTETFYTELKETIRNAGFEVNPKKIRLQEYNQRQEVTGLVVNDKVNVDRRYYKTTRSMAYNLYKNGSYTIRSGQVGTINQLAGRFAYIYQLEKQNQLNQDSAPLSIREKDYQKFLFYKYFIANPKMLVITEGKTDDRYIKAALRCLYDKYPELVYLKKKQFRYQFSILSRSETNKRMLGITDGGGTDLIHLYKLWTSNKENINYWEYFNKFERSKKLNIKPVIFLFDNEIEHSAKPLSNFINSLPFSQKKKEEAITELKEKFFYEINENSNTYIVTLPIPKVPFPKVDSEKKNQKSNDIEIEDLFNVDERHSLDVINKEIVSKDYEGKVFSADFDNKKRSQSKNWDKYVGKELFSKAIAKHYNNPIISFKNFVPLLDLLRDLTNKIREYD